MKQYRGFSSFELILFLCIVGILIFLAVPFVKSIPLFSEGIPDSDSPVVFDNPSLSNHSAHLNDAELNQSEQLHKSD